MAILQPKVQEIAKDLKLTSKEIIEKLSKMGHIVKGPSSQLSEEQLGIIFDIFTNMYDIGDEELVKPPRAKAEPKKAEKKPAAKKEKPAEDAPAAPEQAPAKDEPAAKKEKPASKKAQE